MTKLKVYLDTYSRKSVSVDSLEEASKAIRKYIEENDLRSSDFYGGHVLDDNDILVGLIHYNGRIETEIPEEDYMRTYYKGRPFEYGKPFKF